MIDTHCHLFMPPLGDHPGEALSRARAEGVDRVIIPSYDPATWETTRRLAAEHDGAQAAFGVHPWPEVEAVDMGRLRGLLAGAVAVGEVGLDFAVARTPAARAAQVERFAIQVELAVEVGLPLILHCRKATDDLLGVLAERAPGHPGVVHGFARGPELARRFLDHGLHLGFGCMVVRQGAHRARRSAAYAPLERIVLETDSPAMGLPGLEPAAVGPRHTALVAATLAQLRGAPREEINRRTTANAEALFNLG